MFKEQVNQTYSPKLVVFLMMIYYGTIEVKGLSGGASTFVVGIYQVKQDIKFGHNFCVICCSNNKNNNKLPLKKQLQTKHRVKMCACVYIYINACTYNIHDLQKSWVLSTFWLIHHSRAPQKPCWLMMPDKFAGVSYAATQKKRLPVPLWLACS